jgi:hypothetical protein
LYIDVSISSPFYGLGDYLDGNFSLIFNTASIQALKGPLNITLLMVFQTPIHIRFGFRAEHFFHRLEIVVDAVEALYRSLYVRKPEYEVLGPATLETS